MQARIDKSKLPHPLLDSISCLLLLIPRHSSSDIVHLLANVSVSYYSLLSSGFIFQVSFRLLIYSCSVMLWFSSSGAFAT